MKITICSRCICNSTIPGIEFDEHGVCNFCHEHEERDQHYKPGPDGEEKLRTIIDSIKESGKGKEYDCIVGLSGGTDSTYCLYLTKEMGLRPLAVHFDNGWNSETSVNNILKSTNKLDVDLHTVVVDWESFKDLQIAFLKASVPEADMPTDIAYVASLFQVAAENDIKYIINGSNYRSEGKQPPAWGYGDGKYIESVYKLYGQRQKLENVPNYKLLDLIYYTFFKRIKIVKPLYYIQYNKPQTMELLKKELGWQYYGGHHYENIYTRFVHGYYLPTKFGIDKRIIEYSALIRSNQLSREEALEKIQEPPYSEEMASSDIEYVISKLGLSQDEFDQIMATDNRVFADYNTYYPLIMRIRPLIEIAHRLNLYPDKIHGKYSYGAEKQS